MHNGTNLAASARHANTMPFDRLACGCDHSIHLTVTVTGIGRYTSIHSDRKITLVYIEHAAGHWR